MKTTAKDIQAKQEQVKQWTNVPDPQGNNLFFGERKQSLTSSFFKSLTGKRDKAPYSMFEDGKRRSH